MHCCNSSPCFYAIVGEIKLIDWLIYIVPTCISCPHVHRAHTYIVPTRISCLHVYRAHMYIVRNLLFGKFLWTLRLQGLENIMPLFSININIITTRYIHDNYFRHSHDIEQIYKYIILFQQINLMVFRMLYVDQRYNHHRLLQCYLHILSINDSQIHHDILISYLSNLWKQVVLLETLRCALEAQVKATLACVVGFIDASAINCNDAHRCPIQQ